MDEKAETNFDIATERLPKSMEDLGHSNRKGDWMFTYTGGRFWPLNPLPEDVDIRDIAHHLALINRFSGASLKPYSVAQHSVFVASIVAPENKLWALLHDAPEAYIGDMVRPLKRQPEFERYRDAEDAIMACVCLRFGLCMPMPAAVKYADNVALFTEARDLTRKPEECRTWYQPVDPLPQTVVAWDWWYAEHQFLDAFEEITTSTPLNGGSR